MQYQHFKSPLCCYCGAPATTIDHILPLSAAPLTLYTNTLDHLLFTVSCCAKCNSILNNRLYLTFPDRARHATRDRDDINWSEVVITATNLEAFLRDNNLAQAGPIFITTLHLSGQCLLCFRTLPTNRRQDTLCCPSCLESVRRREKLPT